MCVVSSRLHSPSQASPPPLPLSPSHPRFLSISKKLNTLWLTLSRAATELLAFLFGYVHLRAHYLVVLGTGACTSLAPHLPDCNRCHAKKSTSLSLSK